MTIKIVKQNKQNLLSDQNKITDLNGACSELIDITVKKAESDKSYQSIKEIFANNNSPEELASVFANFKPITNEQI